MTCHTDELRVKLRPLTWTRCPVTVAVKFGDPKAAQAPSLRDLTCPLY
jgi:hypothetical protein